MYSGAIVSARHKSTGKTGWAVFTQLGCGSSSKQFAVDCAAACAMKRSGALSTDPNDFDFTGSVDCFDCVPEDVPGGLLSAHSTQCPTWEKADGLFTAISVTGASARAPSSVDSIELTDLIDDSTDRSMVWNAADDAILHHRGKQHDSHYWIDKTRTDDRWTCYGPYVDLQPGRYRATWGMSLGVSCPPMVTASRKWVVEIDVVANTGTRTLWGPKGATWETACSQTGNVSAVFDVPTGANQVEVRLRKRKWAEYLIAKCLFIERI